MKMRLFGAAVALAMGAAGMAQADTVFFDGFESPSTPGYSYGGSDDAGAVFYDGSGIQQNGSAFGYAAAPEGVQTAHLQGSGFFTELVNGLVAGQTYNLSFYEAARPGYGVDTVTVGYGGEIDPTVLVSTPGSTGFTQVSSNFVYDGSGSTFTFVGSPDQGADAGSNPADDYNIAIDAVRITTVSAAPEPAVWALMFAGVAMVGAALRLGRRREVSAFAA